MGFPSGSDSKESACNAGDLGLIPGSGRSSGERNGLPLQYSCLENSMDRGAWRATVHGVIKKSDTIERLTHTHLSPWVTFNGLKSSLEIARSTHAWICFGLYKCLPSLSFWSEILMILSDFELCKVKKNQRNCLLLHHPTLFEICHLSKQQRVCGENK